MKQGASRIIGSDFENQEIGISETALHANKQTVKFRVRAHN